MRDLPTELLTKSAFALFFVRVLVTPTLDLWAVSVLVLLSALLAGLEALRARETQGPVSALGEEVKTLQNKVASLSVAVGLGGRK